MPSSLLHILWITSAGNSSRSSRSMQDALGQLPVGELGDRAEDQIEGLAIETEPNPMLMAPPVRAGRTRRVRPRPS